MPGDWHDTVHGPGAYHGLVQAAIFLDRDDTLIRNSGDLGDDALVQLLPGVPEGLKQLKDLGFVLVVVTNQGGVARGVMSEADVDAVNQRIAHMVDESTGSLQLIDRFYYCPFHPEGCIDTYCKEHPWRKPAPGMIIQAAKDMNLDLSQSWMIGDSRRDMQAGSSAGCRTILVDPRATAHDDVEGIATGHVQQFSQAVEMVSQHVDVMNAPADQAEDTGTNNSTSDERIISELERLKQQIQAQAPKPRELNMLVILAAVCGILSIILLTLGVIQLNQPNGMVLVVLATFLLCGMISLILFNGRR